MKKLKSTQRVFESVTDMPPGTQYVISETSTSRQSIALIMPITRKQTMQRYIKTNSNTQAGQS